LISIKPDDDAGGLPWQFEIGARVARAEKGAALSTIDSAAQARGERGEPR
jgi:hypothetical protein